MSIQYIEPLSRGFSRMREELFRPFDIKKWFVVGFTAFIAGLVDAGFSGGPGFSARKDKSAEIEAILSFPQKAWEWLMNHPGWAGLIAILVLLGIVIGVLIAWLSARGKFMFLDNVVHGRDRVVAPWHEYRREGNSFFLFNLIWGAIVFLIIAAGIIYCLANFRTLYEASGDVKTLILPAILAGAGFAVFSILNLFVYILLKDFVILIMYRDRSTTLAAVQTFIPLLLSNFIYFLGYELFRLCLFLLLFIGIVIAGCITCCIGFLILMIPYINAVVLLPVSYVLKAYSIEFLEQFGPEFRIFPRPEIVPPPPQEIG